MFVTTPYRHLREVRLETAKRYLEHGEMNVYEARVAVGYANFGNFIGLFRKKKDTHRATCSTGPCALCANT